MHWIAQYLGRPNLNCWGLVRLVYQERYHIILPEIPGISAVPVLTQCRTLETEADRDWAEIAVPFDGCAVAMSQSHSFHHVGIYVDADGGKIVHHWSSQGIIADTLWALRLKGFRSIKYYRHSLWPT